MKRRLLPPVLAFAMLLALCPARNVSAADAVTEAETEVTEAAAAETVERETVHIRSGEEFLAFAQSCHEAVWSDNKEVFLDADITLDGDGNSDNSIFMAASFGGVFDGMGHTVSGVRFNGVASNTGLFGTVQEGAVVRNLKVSGTFLPTGVQTRIGAIAGANYGRIENCEFQGTVSADSEVGGIAGRNMLTGIITDCQVSGSVQGLNACGGIAGCNEGIISNCRNRADVNVEYQDKQMTQGQLGDLMESITMSRNIGALRTVNTRVDTGGIAGFSSGTVQYCENLGRVGYVQVGNNTGGIAGRSSGFIRSCRNSGSILGRSNTGGIAGQQQPYLERDYTQSEFRLLREELDTLSQMTDSLLSKSRGISSGAGEQLSRIIDHADAAKAVAVTLAEIAERDSTEAVARTNDITARTLKIFSGLSEDMTEVDAYVDSVVKEAGYLMDVMEGAISELELSSSEQEDVFYGLQDLMRIGASAENSVTALDRAVDRFLSASDDKETDLALENMLVAADSLLGGLSGNLRTFTDASDALLAVLRDRVYSKAPEKLRTAVDRLNSAVRNAPPTLGHIADYTAELASLDLQIQEIRDEARAAAMDLQTELDSMLTEMRSLTEFLNSSAQSSLWQISGMSGQSEDILAHLIEIIRQQMNPATYLQDRIQDVSEEDLENAAAGRITACTNTGPVSGNSFVGGISGRMGMGLDPDAEIGENYLDSQSPDYVLVSRCVVDNCVNAGQIEGSNGYIGGIAGLLLTGLVTDCENYGGLRLEGSYAGGIAGYSLASIRGSYVKCIMNGGRYVGGVVGYGSSIADCIAVVSIVGAQQFIGAIAGKVADAGDLSGVTGNRYYCESAFGIDGISYAGAAESASYREILSGGGLPDNFRSLYIMFVAGDAVVDTVPCAYGEPLAGDRIPAVPEREGFFGAWSKTDFSNITADEVVTAQYERTVTMLSSAAKRDNGQCVFMAEGTFREGDALTAYLSSAEEGKEVWELSLPDDGAETHNLRFLPPEQARNVRLYLSVDLNLEEMLTETLGSYLTFQASGGSITLVMRSTEDMTKTYLLYGAGSASILAVAAAVFFVLRRKKTSAPPPAPAAPVERSGTDSR